MKTIRFLPNVRSEIRALAQLEAKAILDAIHRYAEDGTGDVKHLQGRLQGLRRLRVGNYRILFDETANEVTIHRVVDRREAYR
ncbi:MAG: type II toxin-antitoxin system RelE/ParE family toxin [Bryobacterales bacterium]|nr:type II toxin-antitoxin system RelE/ParE family toxin [Bryobacterales bacterium]